MCLMSFVFSFFPVNVSSTLWEAVAHTVPLRCRLSQNLLKKVLILTDHFWVKYIKSPNKTNTVSPSHAETLRRVRLPPLHDCGSVRLHLHLVSPPRDERSHVR